MRRRALFVAALVGVMVLGVLLVAGCGESRPEVTSIMPESGAPMTVITIDGSGFGEEKGTSTVQFGGEAIGVKTWSDTTIVATVPEDMQAGSYLVTVNTDAGTSEGVDFEVKAAEKEEEEEETKPEAETEETPQEVIVAYYAAQGNNMDTPTGKATPTLFKASQSDPTWELWYVAWGQGMDADTLLLHEVEGRWTVVTSAKDSLEGTPSLDPQAGGAPADLTWDGWPPQ